MSHLLQEKIIQFNVLFKESETVIDELQAALSDLIPGLQHEYGLDFVQVERIRQYLDDRGTLFRFLRRAGFDFNAALKALNSDLRWRIENDVDSITLSDVHPLFIEKGLFFFHKTDKFGRPCAVVNLREYKREDGSPTIEEVKKFIIYNAEVARRLLLDKTMNSRDGPVLQYVILLDLKGAGVSTLDVELVPFTIDIMRHHFPGSAGAIFVLNYGWMYSGIWQILKRILPEESLNRIFFPSEQELWNYFDEENVLTEQGGKDTYEYDSDTCEAYQIYGNPSPILQLPKPLSRVTSFDSLSSIHDIFYSAHNTPFHSRPSTPFFSRPATPVSSRPSTPYPSRPASPGLDHVAVPNWLKMTPRSRHNPFHITPIDNNINKSNNAIISPNPIKPMSLSVSPMASPNLAFHQEVPALTSHKSMTPINNISIENKDNNDHHDHHDNHNHHHHHRHHHHHHVGQPLHHHHIPIARRSRLKLYFTRLLRKFIARSRVSGFIYYLAMVVLFRGGLMNEFLKLITQQVSMQLGWSASTTTALTTAILSTALSGRAGNRLLRN
ncbi:hypothetical protein RclHR1_05640005 [Rhizophagus clarus]|uniref:Major sperm protein n=1 Tax=Rhizophagus clarus TaxID=94130 RepID=A0A2Z6S6Q3_9GLOM|nr:hypothetical protein RclHR1_05640005 [Rhizophagus clarus]GES96848.1 major sperm protein [Rhizophagus clarus]